MGEGTELSSSSRRLSTLGRTSSSPRPTPLRLGFSKAGGAVLLEVETPFSCTWWMTEGSGGAVSSVAGENEMSDSLFHYQLTLRHYGVSPYVFSFMMRFPKRLQRSAPALAPLSNFTTNCNPTVTKFAHPRLKGTKR